MIVDAGAGSFSAGLYGAPNSPFSLRVRLAARAKGIELPALQLPAGGLRSPAFLAINPAAKIPVLVTPAGLAILESAVILEYLEDSHPRPAILPADPDDRAFMRAVVCMTDRYFMAPVIRLFPHLDPATRNPGIVEQEVARWRAGLDYLDRIMDRPMAPVEAGISMADCVLAPSFHLGTRIAAMIGLDHDPLSARPRLIETYDRLKRSGMVATALKDMTARQEAKDLEVGLPSIAHLH